VVPREEVNYVDLTASQLVSLSTALIPFLEHDDANRALMGSNMQRQAVPLISPEAPIVGTGVEEVVARESGLAILAEHNGIVEEVSADLIIVSREDKEGLDVYHLSKFKRTNNDTCINQIPVVRKGQRVKKGDILADGPAMEHGRLALGCNVLVAFMPWRGYNFEDAIVISEELVRNDKFTSIHIKELEVEARDTKLGREEITKDIPNAGEESLDNLDENGIIWVGAEVQPGDILVGKVTPRGETELLPEERLLRAIFGDKAGNVKNTSLRVPPGVSGRVIDVKVFSRRAKDKDAKSISAKIKEEKARVETQKRVIERLSKKEIKKIILNADFMKEGQRKLQVVTEENFEEVFTHLTKIRFKDPKIREKVAEKRAFFDNLKQKLDAELKAKTDRLKKGDELKPGVNKMVKVYIAQKKKISVGDKISGRHGNKGVLAKILPIEDMPYLPDGTPVQILLNPLGVPSRMNLGQILETHLGWAAKELGYEIITPVFSGAQEGEIKELLTKAHEKTAKEGRGELFKTTGKTILYDGRTGEPFDAEVTVGYIYMMKLSHLADEKIHARSSGSYSLITQQPLGGKAQFGGQRFGEMEVWALEGYGAAHTLQEILTVKSDDVEGRVKIYESIVKGENPPLPGIPESFNVLIKEMQGLALNVELLTERGVKKPGSEGREKIQGLRIGLSSPEKILAQSYGEVKKPDTINYRTYKPEKGGLFCERIFGPVKDWECHCGKYKRMKNKGIICDRCGVEVTLSKVRRERMGHIELATPVTHIWYVRGYPNVISKLLDMKLNTLESIIYYDSYVALSIDEKARRRVLTRLEEDIKRELEEKSALQNTPWEAEESFPRFAEEIRDRREDVIVKVGERVTSRAIAKVKEIGREEIKFSLPVEASIKGKLLAEGEGKPQEITDKVYEAIRSQGRENVTIVEPIEVCLKETVRREKLLQDKLAREIAELQEKLKEAKQTIENLSEGEVISEETYSELNTYQEKYGKFVVLESGGAAVKELLKRLNLPKLSQELRTKLNQGKLLPQQRNEIVKRLRVVNAMLNSKNKPEWMVLDVLPVIPPDLRPLVHLEGGRFATSDLNDFYRRIINRNNRLKWLQEIKAPEIILRNEKRMLQQAVDCLFENGRRGKPITGVGNRPIKSLTDLIKGKTGRFRQNLLGKRVDYSGRAVIVIGPELKLSQCGLPKEVALELFKPFILKELEEKELIHTLRDAKKNFEKGSSKIWDILEKVIKEHPVLLNRAPTLHRLGIQGFMPVLVEGKAISIHPLVCAAFNADFDGDTMAVHVPLSPEAQIETRVLMMSVNNFFSPAHGKPLVTPRQDMVIGCYYLTREKKGAQGEGRIFSSVEELFFALEQKIISLHAKVKVRWEGKILETTPGRVIFNTILPKEMRFINKEIDAKAFITLLLDAWEKVGHTRAVELLDELKGLGFEYATRFGLTIAMDDVKIPEGKERIIEKAEREVNKIISLYKKGVITPRERYNRIIDIWTHATDEISALLFKTLEEDQFGFNPVYMMVDSGSRGSRLQVRQLGGMRGLMAKPSGEIIESPIKRNLREGLSVLEYFISTHGARKGLADTALKTADAGYLTRKLIDVAHNIIVEEEDCGTVNGRLISAVREEGVEGAFSFRDKIIGRVALRDIVHPVDNKIIVKANEEITEECAKQIEEAGVEQVEVRSVLTCIAKRGVCQKCYGRDFTTRKLVELGEAVGIIAAQSIGEPGTQLTMRTFHIGGTASRSIEQSRVIAKVDGSVHFSNLKTVENKEGELVVLTRSALLQLRDVQGREKEVYYLPRGAILKVKDGEKIKENQLLAYWEPYTTPILTEVGGKIRFCDIIEGLTFREEIDEITGFTTRVIVEHKVESREAKKRPQIEIIGERGQVLARYDLPVGAQLVVEEGEEIGPGGVLAKIHKEVSKTKDITGGLPRVTELFEARKPKEAAVISEIDGVVKFGEVSKGIRKVIVEGPGGIVKEYAIPLTKHLTVHDGDKISAAEPLTDGPLDPHALLRVKGEKEVQEYLVNEIQEVYKLQGVEINDKHIEIIVKQMLSRVKIEDAGDTDFIVGTHVDKTEFEEVNYEMRKQGKRTAKARPELIGITRASLATRSFISAASFQETTRVLIDAAITNKVDNLIGLKENVIVGRMVPVGTGFRRYQEELI
jgi:DNA-directed RNA polymerase subunit beta'